MRPLVVKLTHGLESPERAAQALAVCATALGSGAPVSLWLTGEAVHFAEPGHLDGFELAHSPAMADLMAAVLAGGRVSVCSQCAARRGLTDSSLLAGARIAGAAAFVEEVLADGAQALVY